MKKYVFLCFALQTIIIQSASQKPTVQIPEDLMRRLDPINSHKKALIISALTIGPMELDAFIEKLNSIESIDPEDARIIAKKVTNDLGYQHTIMFRFKKS